MILLRTEVADVLFAPNTIQQEIHPDLRPAENSPAEYSDGTYFYLYKRKSRIMIKMTPIPQNGIPRTSKISKLVSHYSKSVSCKNSKCLDFVLVQETTINQKRHNFSFMLYRIKK